MTFDQGLNQDLRRTRQWAMKARGPEFARTGAINFCFDGGGSALVAPMRLKAKVSLACRITMAEILADSTTGAATIDLQHGTFTDHPGSTPLYGLAVNIPTLVAGDLGKKAITITAWNVINLQFQDFLFCNLLTVSGGITNITLALSVRIYPFGTDWGSALVTDSSGNQVVDTAGNSVVQRS